MGRKKGKRMSRLYAEKINNRYDAGEEIPSKRCSAKEMSKKNKRHKKDKILPISKHEKWYMIRVVDGGDHNSKPTKEFLETSFKNSIDENFVMLGYHVSSSAVRFFIENNAEAVESVQSLSRRMTGENGHLLTITVQPCREFMVLNINQMKIVDQVLANRVNDCLLDLSHFHCDKMLMENNVMPVLSDKAISNQVMKIVRNNYPHVKYLNLAKNNLSLASVKTILATMQSTTLERISLEDNNIENIRELLKALKTHFEDSLIEIKLILNPCIKEIKDPFTFLRTILTQLPKIVTVNGTNVREMLASEFNSLDSAGPSGITAPSEPAAAISKEAIEKFLSEYYQCMDSMAREQLVNAFTPIASFEVESNLPDVIPSGKCSGHGAISTVLKAIPRTKHDSASFKLSNLQTSATEGNVEVTGSVLMEGHNSVVEFIQRFHIVPYNSALGCSLTVIGFR